MAKRKTARKWIRTHQDRLAVKAGCWFDEARGRRVVEFFAKFLRHYKGIHAGQPFELLDWQRDEVVMPMFGWMRPDGTRRHRSASIWVPKKQGKTALASGMALVGLIGDGEPGAEVYSAAITRDQAAMIYRNVEKMLKRSPELLAVVETLPSKKRAVYEKTDSFYQALSADAGANEGLNFSMLIQDELHAWSSGPGRELYASLKFGGAARRQPLTIDISTAGDSTESLGFDRYSYAKKVKAGTVDNWELLPVIYEADPEDDPDDEATWIKANPSMGQTVTIESFRADHKEARESGPAAWNDFLRYRLNRWVTSFSQWILPEEWAKCTSGMDSAALDGMACCGGLDLALVNDSTAVVLCFPLDDGRFALLPHFFLPEDGIVEKERKDEVPYRKWARDGIYTLTPGNATDFAYVRNYILGVCDRYDVREVAYDSWQAHETAQELIEKGVQMVEFRQGFGSMSEPCKLFQRLVKGADLEHFGNPALRWMAANAVTRSDPAGNIKLDKAKSRRRIDGVVAAVMAYGRARLAPDGRSVYENSESLAL